MTTYLTTLVFGFFILAGTFFLGAAMSGATGVLIAEGIDLVVLTGYLIAKTR
jgi:hypothetical protein